MRKISFFLYIILGFLLNPLLAQDCSIYYPHEEGVIREMTSYSPKDKETGKIRQEILQVKDAGLNVEIVVLNTLFDEKGEVLSEAEILIGCRDGVFKVDMSSYLSEMLDAYQSMEVELTGDDLAFPAKLNVGDILPEGTMNIKVNNNGMTIMNMDVTLANRKVEAKEEISTPAGSFSCYKISYESIAKTRIITVRTSGTEWIAENTGVVKSETFNKKGKSTGYSRLTALK